MQELGVGYRGEAILDRWPFEYRTGTCIIDSNYA